MAYRGWIAGVLAIFVCLSNTAGAHEFIARPATMTAAAGSELAVAGLSSHIFLISQELEAAKDVKIGVWASGKHTEVSLTQNEKSLSHDGVLKAPTSATFIISGARLPQIWATTPEGAKQATRSTPGATNPYKIEKFSKALVNVTPADNGYSAVIGDALEIVPLANPAALKMGDELPVKVLYRGQPLTTNVFATYDGFSKEENTYAYYTEGHGDGTAKVKITHPGVWMVRVQHATPERTDDYDRYVGRAVLLFEVK